MRRISIFPFFLLMVFIYIFPLSVHAARFVFDASGIPMAGDADWVVDSDHFPSFHGQSNPQRFPSPDPCAIGADTDEEYWTGGYSAWGIELVKSGHWVETIPRNSTLTYGDCDNTMDLSFYDVLVIPEPQLPFSEDEAQAIIEFVYDGGGLFMVGNHCGSDRTNNGYDSTRVFEEIGIKDVFGMAFDRDPDGELHDFCDWDELNNRNFIEDSDDPFIRGPYGEVNAIGFHSATNVLIYPEFNATVKGHAWRNDTAHTDTNITLASCFYGSGRVAAIGDSAPADDGTGDPRDFLANGWSHSTTANDKLFMNISYWLTAPDETPLPTRTPCPNSTPRPGCMGTATPGAPTFTPTPDVPPETSIDVYTNKKLYTGNDYFELKLDIENPGPARICDLYLVLQVVDLYFFFPSWTEEIDNQTRSLGDGQATSETIFGFIWPENSGRLEDVRFWAALLEPATGELIGELDFTSFSAF